MRFLKTTMIVKRMNIQIRYVRNFIINSDNVLEHSLPREAMLQNVIDIISLRNFGSSFFQLERLRIHGPIARPPVPAPAVLIPFTNKICKQGCTASLLAKFQC
jgi:hypothetical protein